MPRLNIKLLKLEGLNITIRMDNILYTFLISVFFCNFSFPQSNVTISAAVYDATTKNPIEFANVGFLNKNLGTLSDNDGYFNIGYKTNLINDLDTLKVSATGYYDFPIPVSKLKSLLDKRQIIFLNPKMLEKTTTLTDKEIWNDSFLGHQSPNPMLSASITDLLDLGGELVTLIPVFPQKTRLKKFQFYINNITDSIKVGINIYAANNNQIGEKLINSKILQVIQSKTGKQTVDLTNENIIVDNDIFIGLEILEVFGDSVQVEIAAAKRRGISFMRHSSQASWEKHLVTAMAYGLEVSTNTFNKSLQGTKQQFDIIKGSDSYITGNVTTSERPIQGCTVRVKGTLKETTTDSKGNYFIHAFRDDVLQFEFMTTKPKSVLIVDSIIMDVNLEAKYTELDEAIVTADKMEDYGENEIMTPTGAKKRRSIGYAAYSKDRDELPKYAASLGQLLVGQFPGLTVNPITNSFQMRGSNSITLSNGPLFVVDNAPSTSLPDFLDVNTITNVTVVPGLAGNILYGTLARNGVIIITTNMALNDRTAEKKIASALVTGNDYTESSKLLELMNTNGKYFELLYSSNSLKSAKEIYEQLTIKNQNDFRLYEEAYNFFVSKDKIYASDILDTITNIANQNPQILRTIAYIHDEKKSYNQALTIYKQIVHLEPHRAQCHLDLARALVNVGEYNSAFGLYKLILTGRIIGATFNDEIIKIVNTELRHLVTKHKAKVPYKQLPQSFYEKAFHLDTRIVFDYNYSGALFEVQFVNPSNKYTIWAHTNIGDEQRLLREIEYGYSTKEFTMENPAKGQWLVNIENMGSKPSYLKYTIYSNYGRPDEVKQVKVLNLYRLKEKVTLSKIEF